MPTGTSTTNQYNAAAYKTYGAFQPQLMRSYLQMATNPLGSNYFQNQLAQNQKQAAQIGQRNVSNIGRNLRTGGGVLSNSGGFQSAMLQRAGLSNSSNQSNAFNIALNNALSNRQWALGGMQGYSPLQTGQQTQKTGWGQYAAPAAAAAAGAFSGGGLLGAMKGASSSLNKEQASASNPYSTLPSTGSASQSPPQYMPPPGFNPYGPNSD